MKHVCNAGQSLGKVNDAYIFPNEQQDMFTGRTAAGILSFSSLISFFVYFN